MRGWRWGLAVGLILLANPGATWPAAAEAHADAKAAETKAAEAKQGQAPARLICPICGRVADPDYGTKASHTLARGATNALLGWTEMIRQPAQEAKEGHSVFTGLNKGITRSLTRTFAGLGELATFWSPKDRQGRYVHFAEDCPLCMGRQK